MQISVKYTDFDRNIKESEIDYENGVTLAVSVKETIIKPILPEEPDVDNSEEDIENTEPIIPPAKRNEEAEEVEEEEVVKTLEFCYSDGVNEMTAEMSYKEVMEYISLLTKIAKQIRQ